MKKTLLVSTLALVLATSAYAKDGDAGATTTDTNYTATAATTGDTGTTSGKSTGGTSGKKFNSKKFEKCYGVVKQGMGQTDSTTGGEYVTLPKGVCATLNSGSLTYVAASTDSTGGTTGTTDSSVTATTDAVAKTTEGSSEGTGETAKTSGASYNTTNGGNTSVTKTAAYGVGTTGTTTNN